MFYGMFLDSIIKQFVYFVTENIAVCREPGENVALECSSAGCPSSIDGYVGMYLYYDFREQEAVLYYHLKDGYEKISPRPRYKNRIQKNGSLKNHTITISNLTLNDSGLYSCVYKKTTNTQLKCNNYTLIVRGMFFFFFSKLFSSLYGRNTVVESSSSKYRLHIY